MRYDRLSSSVASDLMLLMSRKQFDAAAALLRQKLKDSPSDIPLQRELTDVLILAGKLDEAAQALRALSNSYAWVGEFSKAVAALKKVGLIAPGDSEVEQQLRELVAREEQQRQREQKGPHVREVSGAVRQENSYIIGTPLFGEFSGDELLAIVHGMRLLTFQPGDLVVSEGEPGDSLFILTSGSVKAFVRGADGRFRKAREMNDGDFFGEIAILTGRPRTATITASIPCEILELTRATVDQITENHPKVRDVLVHYAERRTAEL